MKLSIVAITALLASATCAPTTNYAIHEKRHGNSRMWTPRDIELDRRARLPISISLTHQNLDKGYGFLLDVSDANNTFALSAEAVGAVKAWLESYGIHDERLSVSKSGSWIHFISTIDEAEALMQTKYRASLPFPVYEHAETKKTHIACDEYSVPAEIKTHIDFITPTIEFGAVVRELNKTRALPKRYITKGSLNGTTKLVGLAVAGERLALPPPPPPSNNGLVARATSPTYCDQYITPDCLRALYEFPVGSLATSSYGIVEFTPNGYLQSDLNLFYASLATNAPTGYAPTLKSIDSRVNQQMYQGFAYNGDADLDLQYAIALVYPQKVTLYQAGDMIEGGSFNNFLDAIYGSSCTYSGGDFTLEDPVYPDPTAGGYKGAKNCGTFTPIPVISISYAYNEADLPIAYMNRQCTEYMKLGLQGVTIVTSSGDHTGAAGAFNPSFPGTCPYITSVTAAEEACATVICSGGGSSNNFALPAYQGSAVATYFKSHEPSYSTTLYNASGKTRAIPDISANGENYLCAVDGAGKLIYGTSASAPTVAHPCGKSAVGFINPVLYANPKALNDIKKGTNPGCGTKGFSAVSGWDPLTGLGTPNYPAPLKVFVALP
ncbi:subtilisin-like protein [Acephala macrosclerotiorum]|nr:subtilisin-like protein [Acephala macrosclerotiorum]